MNCRPDCKTQMITLFKENRRKFAQSWIWWRVFKDVKNMTHERKKTDKNEFYQN